MCEYLQIKVSLHPPKSNVSQNEIFVDEENDHLNEAVKISVGEVK